MKFLALVLLAGCVSSGAILEATHTAYAAAMTVCLDREQSIVAAARAERLSPEAALTEFDAVSQRCHRTRAAFEVVLTLIEDGRLEEAEAALRRLRGVP